MSIDAHELRRAIEDVLRAEAGLDRVRAAADEGSWLFESLRGMASELGWPALAAPEENGGLGLSATDLIAAHEEIGRHLVSFPMLAHILCVRGLAYAKPGDERLEALASGEHYGAAALPGPNTQLVLSDSGSIQRLNGTLRFVLDSRAADVLLIPATRGKELCWLLIDPNLPGITRRPVPFADQTRQCEDFAFSDVLIAEGAIIAHGADADRIAQSLMNEAHLALAADSIGGARSIMAITIEYLCTRQQFGKLIGSFQALKHRCADLEVALHSANALLKFASQRLQEGDQDASAWIFMAKGRCSATYHQVAAEAIQMHGGIGFTWESSCHLFLKRAKLNEQLFGTPMEGALALAEKLLA